MNTFRSLSALALAATIGLASCDLHVPTSLAVNPFAKTTHRSIQEFVDAQGTFCFPDGAGGCVLFVPPVENYIGWGSPSQDRSVSMDYAGVANRHIVSASGGTVDLGTSYAGSITEKTLDDGRALISLDLKTKNVLTYAVAPMHAFADGTLLFGNRAPAVAAGATPAMGDCHLTFDFILAHPGDPLPDMLQILAFPTTGQEVRRLTFEGSAKGPLHAAFGVVEGTAGRLQVTQIGNFQSKSKSPTWDGFPAEHVNITVGN